MYLVWDKVQENYKTEIYVDIDTALTDFPDSFRYEIIHRQDKPWMMRELWRLEDHSYTEVLWSNEPWFQRSIYSHNTYPHIKPNESDSSLIWFTENDDKGSRDIQTQIKPGKFLTKYFSDVLSKNQIKEWVDRHRECYGVDHDIQWANTPEEIEKVYSMEATFDSCMQGNKKEWVNYIGHPARAYGYGDLSVAYIAGGGRLLARALYWPGNKIDNTLTFEQGKVGRVYGDGPKLRKALAKVGIKTTSNHEKYNEMVGARLMKLPVPKNRYKHRNVAIRNGYESEVDPKPYTVMGDFVCPYIDGKNIFLRVQKDCLVISDKMDILATHVVNTQEGFCLALGTCICCGGVIDDIMDVVDSYDPTTNKVHYTRICDDCTEQHSFRCSVTNRSYLKSNFTEIKLGTSTYGKACYEVARNFIFRSAKSGKWYPLEHAVGKEAVRFSFEEIGQWAA